MAIGTWTNNWRGIKNVMLLGHYKEGMTTIRPTSGTIAETPADGYARAPSAFASTRTDPLGDYTYIRVGGSSTTPTVNDTALNATINSISYLSVANEAITYDTENGTATRVVKLSIYNNSASQTVTVAEWGLFCFFNNNGNSYYVMLYHGLLDSPVTLAPYQSATLTLTLDLTLNDPL